MAEYQRGRASPALIRQHRLDISRMLRQQPDITLAEIGRRIGLTRERVRQLAPPVVVERRRRNDEERGRRVIELRQENHTFAEIASELGMSTTTIQNRLREAGLLGRPISRSRQPETCLLGLHDLSQPTYVDQNGVARKSYYRTQDGSRRCARCDLERQRRVRSGRQPESIKTRAKVAVKRYARKLKAVV